MNRTILKIKPGRKINIICCFFCFYFFGACLLYAGPTGGRAKNEILSIGTARIVKGNLARAKDNAISMALSKGVENYILHRLGSQAVANNFMRLLKRVLPMATKEIQDFHILAEEQIGDEYYVFVGLRVNKEVIEGTFQKSDIILREGLPVKLLFLVSETIDGKVSYWWKNPEDYPPLNSSELVIYDIFRKKGFKPINRTLSIPDTEYYEELKVPDLQTASVLKWGRLFSADVVISGHVDIIDEKEITLMLKAFDLKNGLMICQGIQTENITKNATEKGDVMAALERLSNRLIARLSPAITRFVGSSSEEISHLKITMKRLSSYSEFRDFKDFLKKNIKGVSSVKLTRIKKNSLTVSVEFHGDRKDFLKHVLNHKHLPFPLYPEQTTSEEIILDVR